MPENIPTDETCRVEPTRDRLRIYHPEHYYPEDVNEQLLATGDFNYLPVEVDRKERSIEMQLPFVVKAMQKYLKKLTVVPIYLGTLTYDQQMVIARHFLPYLADPANLFIFSTSLCHWGEIYGMNTLLPETQSVQDTLHKLDDLAAEALEKLRFKAFDNFLMDTKSKVPDYQVITVCMWLIQLYLDHDLYELSLLSDEDAANKMQKKGLFTYFGDAISFPEATVEDSAISFISATIRIDEVKYMLDDPEEENPLNKCV